LQETKKKSLIPRNVLVLTMSRTIWSMSDTNLDNFISAYMLALGATVPAIGLMNALGSFGAMLMYPIGGYIADKSGRVKLVAYSTLLYVSSFIVYLFAPTWQWAAFAMVYQQMVLFYVPAMNAIMADSIPVGDRGKLFGFNFALPNLIRIVAPYIGGLFIARFELIPAMRIGFTFSLVIGLVVTAMRMFYLRETIEHVEEMDWNPVRLVKAAYKDMDVSLRWIWRNIRSYAGVTMLLSFLSSMILPFWIIYVVKEIGLDPYLWGVILLWSGVAKAVLSLFIGGIVDRFGSRNCFIAGLLVSIPGMYMFTFAEGFRATLLIYTVIVLGAVLIWISSQVYLADSIPKAMRGRVMAGLGSGITLGVTGVGFPTGFLVFFPKILGNLVGGLIYSLRPSSPWTLQSMLLAAALVYLWFMLKNPEKAEE
jgi:MFS family permease